MQILKASDGTCSLNVDEEELTVLNNALNEICNGIHIAEFETRVGATMQIGSALANTKANGLPPSASSRVEEHRSVDDRRSC